MSQRNAMAQELLLAGWLTLGTVVVWLLLAIMADGLVQKITFFNRVEQLHRWRFLDNGDVAETITGSVALTCALVMGLGGLSEKPGHPGYLRVQVFPYVEGTRYDSE